MPKHDNIKWNPDEIDLLATRFVELRSQDFKTPLSEIWRAVFKVLPEHRKRKKLEDNPAWTLLPFELQSKIKTLWNERLQIKPPEEPAEPPAPIFLRVEVPKPIDLADILRKTDTSVLVAQVVTRFMEGQARTEALLTTIATRLGSVVSLKPEAAATPAATPPRAPVRKPKRVAIVGPLDSQFAEIEQFVKEENLFVETRFLDKDHKGMEIPPSCDFAIITRHTRHSWFDTARTQIGNGNVYFVDGPITAVKQKLRDIASLT